MRQNEALAEARRRFGPTASTMSSSTTSRVNGEVISETAPIYYIYKDKHAFFSVGSGDSWEAAFADADRRGVTR